MTLSDWLRHIDTSTAAFHGPVNKGGAASRNQAIANESTAATDASTLLGESQDVQNELLPFLTSEMQNPSGLPQSTLNAMTTSAGQTASGRVADATQQAQLRAARSGNTAGESAIIANAARSGGKIMSDAALQTQIENAQTQLEQQQAGAQGVGSVMSGDLNAALGELGISNQAINSWANAEQASQQGSFGQIFGNILQAGAQGALAGAKL